MTNDSTSERAGRTSRPASGRRPADNPTTAASAWPGPPEAPSARSGSPHRPGPPGPPAPPGPPPPGPPGAPPARPGPSPRPLIGPPPDEPPAVRLGAWGAVKVVAAAVWVVACMVAGQAASDGLFRLVGRPAQPWAYLIAVAGGFVLVVLGAMLSNLVAGRGRPDLRRDGGGFGQDVMAALDRIAHGDFSVRLPADRRHPLIELIDSVNNLAAELGDLEAQRQGFISNVSHEIQSPLTSIGGFARLLRDPSLTLEAREHYLDIIEAETRRLSKLSDNLLRLSALETGALERQRYRLDEQLRDVILLLEPQWAAKDLDLELATDPSGTEIVADRDLLCQVWINLVQNAIKFTPATGWVRVVLTPAADGWCCQVADSGPGIDPADRPHVFERFYRGDKARGGDGNGLGLALVKRVVELHSGRVDLASAPGAGTAVTVYLPLTQS